MPFSELLNLNLALAHFPLSSGSTRDSTVQAHLYNIVLMSQWLDTLKAESEDKSVTTGNQTPTELRVWSLGFDGLEPV